MMLSISSPAFQEEERIPSLYTCQGEDISPQLDWSGVPEDTRSLALIMDDPDAPSGIFTHWVIFNLPPDSQGLAQAVPSVFRLDNGALQGRNDFDRIGYGGPCPPPGYPHRYRFTLYALDKQLELEVGSYKNQVVNAAKSHTLAQCQLIGTYQR